jgi:hypothetical protein
MLAWTIAVGVLLYFGTSEFARGAAILDCRLPGATLASRACLLDRESWWFWSSLRTTALAYFTIGILLPLTAQAMVRFTAHKLGWGSAAN